MLQKNAKESCESAKGMPDLGVNFNWTHNLTGDFDPSFEDRGTFDWGYYTGSKVKTYEFVCTGRFDDSHLFAQSVLDSINTTDG